MHPLLVILLALNLVAFGVYGWDKWRATKARRRVPERWLLGLALPFASPGAWCGVRLFRHKTRKPSFLWKLVLLTVVQAALAGWALGRFDGPWS